MTVQTSSSAVTYTGNGATTNWSYNFIIPEAGDVVVSLTVIATDIVTVLNSSQYSITGLNNPAGGSVTYPLSGSPLASTHKITIQRILDLVQDTDLTNQDGFYPETLEEAFDYGMMVSQQLQEQLDRSIIAPVGSDADLSEIVEDVLAAAGNAAAAAASATAAAASAAQVLAAMPVGAELDWPTNTAPAQWFLEYGQVVLRADFPELFAVLGTTYNTGGETGAQFRLPDARGVVYAGKTNMGGVDSANLPGGDVLNATLGAATVTLDVSQLPSHNHGGNTGDDTPDHTHAPAVGGGFAILGVAGATWKPDTSGPTATQSATGGASVRHTHPFTTNNTGGGGAHGNVQPTRIRNKIIFAGRPTS